MQKNNNVKWHSTKNKLPDKTTKYSSTYGVNVLIFNENEHKDAKFDPTTCFFLFGNKKTLTKKDGWFGPGFYEYCHNLRKKFSWLPVEVTHWAELPAIPDTKPFRPKKIVVAMLKTQLKKDCALSKIDKNKIGKVTPLNTIKQRKTVLNEKEYTSNTLPVKIR